MTKKVGFLEKIFRDKKPPKCFRTSEVKTKHHKIQLSTIFQTSPFAPLAPPFPLKEDSKKIVFLKGNCPLTMY